MKAHRLIFGLAIAGLAATASTAQVVRPTPVPGEAIIYRDRNFQGSAVNVSNVEANLRLSWRVNSVRLASGRMELCSQANFRGTCRVIDRSYTYLTPLGLPNNAVQSMRPVLTGSNTTPTAGVGPVLRGMAASFYPQPSRNGQRLRACDTGAVTAACASRTAQAFCRSQGYNFVGNVRQQTVNREVFLADVLCRTSNG